MDPVKVGMDSIRRFEAKKARAAGSSAPACWQPTSKEAQYVKLIMSMCADCLMHSGTMDYATFTSNLRMIADQLDQIANTPPCVTGAASDMPCREGE